MRRCCTHLNLGSGVDPDAAMCTERISRIPCVVSARGLRIHPRHAGDPRRHPLTGLRSVGTAPQPAPGRSRRAHHTPRRRGGGRDPRRSPPDRMGGRCYASERRSRVAGAARPRADPAPDAPRRRSGSSQRAGASLGGRGAPWGRSRRRLGGRSDISELGRARRGDRSDAGQARSARKRAATTRSIRCETSSAPSGCEFLSALRP